MTDTLAEDPKKAAGGVERSETEEPAFADTDLGRHKAAVLAPLANLRRMGGNWTTVVSALEAVIHALFAGPPQAAEPIERDDSLDPPPPVPVENADPMAATVAHPVPGVEQTAVQPAPMAEARASGPAAYLTVTGEGSVSLENAKPVGGLNPAPEEATGGTSSREPVVTQPADPNRNLGTVGEQVGKVAGTPVDPDPPGTAKPWPPADLAGEPHPGPYPVDPNPGAPLADHLENGGR